MPPATPRQDEQRLRRIARAAGATAGETSLALAVQDVLGAGALLGAQQHGLEQVAVDGGVALQRLEPDGLVVDRPICSFSVSKFWASAW